ncbi:MAG: fumarylacetoacetate hydrolase family protein [Dongiaceae bacterium]
MEQEAVRRAAGILWSAWQDKRFLDGLPPDCRPRDLAEAYEVQAAMGELIGGPQLGWKIAATSRDGQRHIGVDEPLGAPLYRRMAYKDGDTMPLGLGHMKAAEAEFAFRLGRDLPGGAAPYGVDAVMAAVDALFLAIEVPDSRYADFAAAGAPQLVADQACACFFVLGPEAAPGWRQADLAAHPVKALRNGAVVAEGSGANVLGDPRLALTWLANDRVKRGRPLRAGEVVTTGTCVKPVTIAPGDALVADFGSLGRVSVTFAR